MTGLVIEGEETFAIAKSFQVTVVPTRTCTALTRPLDDGNRVKLDKTDKTPSTPKHRHFHKQPSPASIADFQRGHSAQRRATVTILAATQCHGALSKQQTR